MERKPWEYHVEVVSNRELSGRLMHLGRLGWELVNAYPVSTQAMPGISGATAPWTDYQTLQVTVFLKRPSTAEAQADEREG